MPVAASTTMPRMSNLFIASLSSHFVLQFSFALAGKRLTPYGAALGSGSSLKVSLSILPVNLNGTS